MPCIVVLKVPFFCWTCLDWCIIEVEQCRIGKGPPGTPPATQCCSSQSLEIESQQCNTSGSQIFSQGSTFPLSSLTQGPCFLWVRAHGFALWASLIHPVPVALIHRVLQSSLNDAPVLFTVSDPVPLHITDEYLNLRPGSCTEVNNKRIEWHRFPNASPKNTTDDNLAQSGSPDTLTCSPL